MREQNTAFEKLYGEIPHDIQSKLNYQEAQSHFNVGYRAATAEANKRIAELEGDNKIYAECNAELKDFFAKKYVPNKDISILEKDIKELKEIASYHNTHCSEVNARVTELQSHINTLREALEKVKAQNDKYGKDGHIDHVVVNALYSTPAESLQAFENEVIEKCANVCDEQATEWDSDSQITHLNYAEHCAMVIRSLKEVK